MRKFTPIVLSVLFAGSMLFYVQRVLIPYQQQDSTTHDRPRGNLSDLYPRWLGARELLRNGRDPYSPEISREIQQGYYGRVLDASRPNDPKDQQGFAYPVYVVFLLAPTISLPFSIVQETFFWILLLAAVASVPLWLAFLRWRPSNTTVAVMVLLTVASFPVVQGLKLQQLSLLVTGFLALGCALLSCSYLIPAGILMALATIKPQLALPIAGWLCLWSLMDWKTRRSYLLSFASTLGVLFAASEWVLPGWIPRFRDAVAEYRVYTGGGGSLLDALAGPLAGRIAALAIVLLVGFVCWKARRFAAGTAEFSTVSALVLTATVVIIPTIAPYNQVLMLPGILLIVRRWRKVIHRSLAMRAAMITCSATIVWPWIAATGLVIFSIFSDAARVQQLWPVPLYSSLFIPLSVFVVQVLSPTMDEARAESCANSPV